MSPSEFDSLRQKYPNACKTQSTNACVLEIYSIVLIGEHRDSDYWNEEHGASDIIRVFENCFTANDWKELEDDLKNWTTAQLELFTEAILSGYYSYTDTGVYYDHYDIETLTKTVPNRLNLLLPILAIERKRALKYRELSWIIIENSNFINDHFEIVVKRDAKNRSTIQMIFQLLNVSQSDNPSLVALKNKMDQIT